MERYKEGYGKEPNQVGEFLLDVDEMMFYMYLPIKMPNSSEVYLPERLGVFKPLVIASASAVDDDVAYQSHIYITAKHVYVTPTDKANRFGWHSDGFMTNDKNFIWMDCCPTEFAIQPLSLIQDEHKSLKQMQNEIDDKNIIKYPTNQLLMLDQFNIHRVSESDSYSGMRTFVKISFSKRKYNLKGNSHNYMIDYDWKMYERGKERNVTDIT